MKYVQRQTTLGRKQKFDEFHRKMLKETSKMYCTYKELCLNPPKADLYIVGSDQIWNIFYETGRDPAFYLEFVSEGAKASYAASFSYLDINEENKTRIKKSLQTLQVWGMVVSLHPKDAEVAQLVEHNLPKVGVASSSLVFRS